MKQDMRNGFMVTWQESGEVLIQVPSGNRLIDLIVLRDDNSLKDAINKLRYLMKFRRELDSIGTLKVEIPDSPAISIPETKGMGSKKKKREAKAQEKANGPVKNEDLSTKPENVTSVSASAYHDE